MYYNFITHSSINDNLVWFYVTDIVNNTAINKFKFLGGII